MVAIEFTPRAFALEVEGPVDESQEDKIRNWLENRGIPNVMACGLKWKDGLLYLQTNGGTVNIRTGDWLVLYAGQLWRLSAQGFNLFRDGVARG
jgi:hypothetical protein